MMTVIANDSRCARRRAGYSGKQNPTPLSLSLLLLLLAAASALGSSAGWAASAGWAVAALSAWPGSANRCSRSASESAGGAAAVDAISPGCVSGAELVASVWNNSENHGTVRYSKQPLRLHHCAVSTAIAPSGWVISAASAAPTAIYLSCLCRKYFESSGMSLT